MVFKRKAMVLALLAMYFEFDVAFANSPLQQKLIEQAQFWEQRGRDDNAADAWGKLLKVDPDNIDALVALGMYEARSGHPEQAKTYLEKLKQLKATQAQIRPVDEAIRRGAVNPKVQLEDARKLARQGDVDAAADSFRLLGDPSRLKGDAALEYYQVLAGTLNGYNEAKSGQAKLVKENPTNLKYALAYAQTLTYRDAYRHEGIGLLENLSNKPEVSKQANEAWRQALSWMGVAQSDSKYYRAYLEKHPDDKMIQTKLANIGKVPKIEAVESSRAPNKPKVDTAFVKGQSAGFAALDDNDVPTAEKEFTTLIKTHPKDPVGYGGMGLVKMRQEEFVESRKYLEKALKLSSSSGRGNWKQAYDGANYWAIIEEARSAFEDDDSAKGIALLRKAIALNSKEPSGILQLADALKADNDMVGAEENYKRVFNADKTNMRALDGLVGIYDVQKRLADMEALTPYMLPRQLAILANLKSSQLVEKAKQLEAAGDINGAQMALEDAILIKPEDAWLRMALAKIYLKRNMPGQAQALLDVLTNVDKPEAEALYVSALLSQLQQLWWEGLATLERIPPNARRPEMFTLQKRLWIRVQLDRIDLLNKRGKTEQVREILGEINAAADKDPEFVGTVAALYIKLGDTERGYAMIRQAVQDTPKPSASLLLEYATTLMQANQEAELEAVMRRVASMPKLNEDEVAAFKQLQKALAMRYSDRAREAGDYASAYTYIQPMLIENPDDNLLLLALARIYSSSGDTDSAKELYVKVLKTEPDNPEVLQGLVFAAIQVKDFKGAEENLDKLMHLQPDNPRFIALAGNVARAQGQNGKALGYFKKALAMEQAQRPLAGDGKSGAGGLRLVDPVAPVVNVGDFKVNPFAERKTEAVVTKTVAGPALKEVPQLPSQYTTPASSALKVTNPAAAVGVAATVPVTSIAPASVGISTAPVVPVNSAPVLKSVPSLPSTQPAAVQVPVPVKISPTSQNTTFNSNTVAKAATQSPAQNTYTTAAMNGRSSAIASTSPMPTSSKGGPAVSPEEEALMREIDSLNELNRSEVTVGLSARARSGQSGLSQLKDLEIPIEAHVSTLGYGQFGLKIIPVTVDPGVLNLNDPNSGGLFGKNVILSQQAQFANVPFTTIARQQGLSNAASIDQVAKGVALSLSYELSGFKVDIGSSPIGFPIKNVVGGIRWSNQVDDMNFSVELARRSVTDSYLSYAGARDSIYGLSWGGVTKNGLRVDAAYNEDDGGVYGGLGFAELLGTNVVKNTALDFGGGAYWRVYKTKNTSVTVGLNLTTMFYKKNLQNFTYGNGGYFSPQSYYALNLPVEVSGRSGKLSYQLGAAIGVQSFRADAALYYPLVSADQTSLELFAAANPKVSINTTYAGQTHTGIQYKLAGAAEYLLSPHFALGGRMSVDNSGDFTDASALVYLRYTFEPKRGPVSFPPVAPKPYYMGN
ncbi:cellulose synthase subunit BcsC-related outer membrane protein [Undibacterium sp. Dicai25W]|uniref:cellulose synthase subunit BcsC-related outer membrane protein n=1 Tax=Undibacterium sp. Dicai25W TaxID=3413034 RepID=UPI003BF335E7